MYLTAKNIHMLLIALSVAVLSVHYVLLMVNSSLTEKKSLKIAPHVVDVLLLLSGFALTHIMGFVPFSAGSEWLTEKMVYIFVYFILAFFTLHNAEERTAKKKGLRTLTFFGALGCILMISKIAITKTPLLFN